MKKKKCRFCPMIIPERYKYSDFFHDAIAYAREHSLNTNELCLELSAYLFENKKQLERCEKEWLKNEIKLKKYLEEEKKENKR